MSRKQSTGTLSRIEVKVDEAQASALPITLATSTSILMQTQPHQDEWMHSCTHTRTYIHMYTQLGT